MYVNPLTFNVSVLIKLILHALQIVILDDGVDSEKLRHIIESKASKEANKKRAYREDEELREYTARVYWVWVFGVCERDCVRVSGCVCTRTYCGYLIACLLVDHPLIWSTAVVLR